MEPSSTPTPAPSRSHLSPSTASPSYLNPRTSSPPHLSPTASSSRLPSPAPSPSHLLAPSPAPSSKRSAPQSNPTPALLPFISTSPSSLRIRYGAGGVQFYMRYLELFVSLLYISVLIYSRAHPGNWNRLDAIVGVGAVITAATWGHIGYGLAVLHRNDSTLVVVSRKAAVLPMEVGAALAWSATGAFMCFPTQGQVDVYANSPPFIAWGFAVVLAFILAVFFLVSAIVGVLLCRAIRWEKESSGWIV